MNESSTYEEKSILEEIEDLSRYLDGIPKSLRASGAFAAYDARLKLLQKELVVASLHGILKRSGMGLAELPAKDPLSSLTDQQFVNLWRKEIHRLEQNHQRAANFYTKVARFINAVILILLMGGLASTIVFSWPHDLIAPSSIIVGALVLAQLFLRLPERSRKEQMAADLFTAVNMELEMLATRNENGGPEAREIDESVIRLHRLFIGARESGVTSFDDDKLSKP
jgi:hypothetical protein